MQQKRHHVEGRVPGKGPRFLHSHSLRKREGEREMLSFSLAFWRSAFGVVEGKRSAVCRAGVGAQSFERARHTMIDQT
jgi:hypothetical protein